MAINKEQKKLLSAYKYAFEGPNGQAVLADLKLVTHDRLSFHKDPYITAFREGRRSVYLDILAAIESANQQERGKNARTSIESESDESDESADE